MKFIVKKYPEPIDFVEWKEQEKEALESCYKKPKVDKPSECAWNHLPSNLPDNAEKGIKYYSKKQLKDEILDEQGFICAFCMNKLENNYQCTLDHLKPKSANPTENTFDYYNLLAVCEGKNPLTKPLKDDLRHCNNKKEDKLIEISPLELDCEEKFIFDAVGNIYPKIETDQASINTIKILGLDSIYMVNLRKDAIERILYPDQPELDEKGNLIKSNRLITSTEAQNHLQSIDRKSENKFHPFCLAIKCILENFFP